MKRKNDYEAPQSKTIPISLELGVLSGNITVSGTDNDSWDVDSGTYGGWY